MVTDFDGSASLNFSRLISQYVQLFISDDSDSALQYLYLITLYPTKDMFILCRQHIIDYVVKYRNYQKLIGGVSVSNYQSYQGAIEKFKSLFGIEFYDDQTYKDSILYPIAKKFHQKGEYENAVNVYELSGRHTDALRVLNDQLDIALNNQDNGHINSEKDRLVQFSTQTKTRYDDSIDINCLEDVKTTHKILLGFLKASIAYKKGEYAQTIEVRSSKLHDKE